MEFQVHSDAGLVHSASSDAAGINKVERSLSQPAQLLRMFRRPHCAWNAYTL